jgi:hypothetical protein
LKLQKKAKEQQGNYQQPLVNKESLQLPQRQQAPLPPSPNSNNNNGNNNNIHEILMDEFKKAHKKMFKNGFIENEYQHRMVSESDALQMVIPPPPPKFSNNNNGSSANVEVSKVMI